ncbi:hypothetical protein [Methylobacterium sp. WSM2598]|uniref:hypothetical protein n=1 Tax=Methylobacterium sp. WSM2598 TaxID=398261 RepID=UPI000382F16C|nr:hypothetical protein [Methylobacterium sp. WSM2598]
MNDANGHNFSSDRAFDDDDIEHADFESPLLAREIMSHLRNNHIHPVMIFGTNSSGKTMMLLSLIDYIKSSDDAVVDVQLGAPIWPRRHGYFAPIEEAARAFFENQVAAFGRGYAAPRTQRETPYFIPVNIVHERRTVKFAFLEGMGEWFEQQKPAAGQAADASRMPPFLPFRNLLKEILQHYELGMSLIFVAPTVAGPDGESAASSHECLSNAMHQVDRLRGNKNRDNLLLLISKWDACCPPGVNGSGFSDATASTVLDRIARWRVAWPKFAAMTGFPAHSKALMPYSAAWVQPDRRITHSPIYAPVFRRFNRTLWNWLYGNATAALPHGGGAREILYADVVPSPVEEAGPYETLTRVMILSVFSKLFRERRHAGCRGGVRHDRGLLGALHRRER